MSAPLIVEYEPGLAIMTLNNPARANLLDLAMAQALAEAVGIIAAGVAAGTVRAILITGSGKHFCAGGDVHSMQDGSRPLPDILDALVLPIHGALAILSELPVPVVSAINGPVGGGGIGLGLSADIVLAAESMKLRGGYSALGLTPDVGSTWFVTQRAGCARAKEIFLTNRAISAAECLQVGLVDAVHPDAVLHETALALVRQLARGPAAAQARIKTLINAVPQHSLRAHLDAERAAILASGETADAREGVQAFIEKRAARFS